MKHLDRNQTTELHWKWKLYCILSGSFLIYTAITLGYYTYTTRGLEGEEMFAAGLAFASFFYVALAALAVSLFTILVFPVFYKQTALTKKSRLLVRSTRWLSLGFCLFIIIFLVVSGM